MLNGYHYTGPLPLGSVVAHNCGAAGLFSSNTDADVKLSAVEYDDMYILTVSIRGAEHTLTGSISSLGRRCLPIMSGAPWWVCALQNYFINTWINMVH